VGGIKPGDEIPLLLMLFYLFGWLGPCEQNKFHSKGWSFFVLNTASSFKSFSLTGEVNETAFSGRRLE